MWRACFQWESSLPLDINIVMATSVTRVWLVSLCKKCCISFNRADKVCRLALGIPKVRGFRQINCDMLFGQRKGKQRWWWWWWCYWTVGGWWMRIRHNGPSSTFATNNTPPNRLMITAYLLVLVNRIRALHSITNPFSTNCKPNLGNKATTLVELL